MKTFHLKNKPRIDSGFKVPENYFEDFSSRVLPKLIEKEPKVILLYTKRKKWIYAVAAIFILGMLLPMYTYLKNSYSDLNHTNVEDYIVYNSTITDSDLAYLLDKNDFEKLNTSLNIDDKTIENELSKNSDLEQYLIN
ncbi:hypothetical protein [Flavobacterium sp.]|uniref:hypothetical protein n=1 Tax=Flavobacterium sp. TaxID=239 RepID=UPI0038FC9343